MLTITLENLRWSATKETIANHMRLHIDRSQICALMGRSGVGKSTVLKKIAGWMSDLEGNVQVEDSDGPVSPHEIAILPQNCEDLLLPWYTIKKNWELAAEVSGKPLDDVVAKKLINDLGLQQEQLFSTPGKLSGGEQRRAALGMGLLRGAKLLLLDEPLAGLDSDARVRVLDLLHYWVRSPADSDLPDNIGAVLIIAHGFDDVAALCDMAYLCDESSPSLSLNRLDRPASLNGLLPSKIFFGDSSLPESSAWCSQLRAAGRPRMTSSTSTKAETEVR